MEYSEDFKRQVENYIASLVDSQPLWIRRLFEKDLVWFSIDEYGTLDLAIDKSVPKKRIGKVSRRISLYLSKHPTDFLQKILVH